MQPVFSCPDHQRAAVIARLLNASSGKAAGSVGARATEPRQAPAIQAQATAIEGQDVLQQG